MNRGARRTLPRSLRSGSSALALGALLLGGVDAQAPAANAPFAVTAVHCPRVADPKLAGARIPLGFELRAPDGIASVTITLQQHGALVGCIWSGRVVSGRPRTVAWDGRLAPAPLAAPRWVDPGSYEVRVDARHEGTGLAASASVPLDVVRLGITEITAVPDGPQSEWQMVWFRRGTQPGTFFYAAPALREYLNVASTGELADLDRPDGSPRPPVPVHTNTASPAMEGLSFEDDAYNYPVCYLAGRTPRFEVRFGTQGVGKDGLPVGAKYPVPGVVLRCRADSTLGPWTSSHLALAPGQSVMFAGPPLPAACTRTDAAITWTFVASSDGGQSWQPVPGSITTQHRFYTVLGVPRFASTSGVQHGGPWVEVAEYAHTWQQAIGTDTSTPAGLADVIVRGFGGQVPGIPTAIEGVRYDTTVLGGDGGASHYYNSAHAVQLSRLLDNHANGVFVNCSDCASATAAMLAMLGVQQVQMQRLGSMTLRAIRGIGAPAYTLSLWGPGYQHGFSYHHVVTRSGGSTVIDACLWVDADGNPNQLPGQAGFNVDRPWTGLRGYQPLLAWGPIGYTLEPLPILQ